MAITEHEHSMTIKQHLNAAARLLPDPPKPGDVIADYQRDMLMAERHLFLARLKMARNRS